MTDNHQPSVLVDTDTGIDDALALLTVLAHPADLIGVGAVFGNCTEQQAAANALTVLAAAGRTDIPVAIGSPRPGPTPAAPSPHGADGLGDTGLRPPTGAAPADDNAVDQILRTANDRPGNVDLLCLAPLTNIAAALAENPLVLSGFRTVTIMGGMGAASRRDTVAAALPKFLPKGDTNTNHDPAATARVAAAPGPVTWVGMDVTGQLQLPWGMLTDLAATSPLARFVHTISDDYHRYCTDTYAATEPIVTSHDTVAAVVMLDPSVVTSAQILTGHVHDHDGRSSLWGEESAGTASAHRFVTGVDYTRVTAHIKATLAAPNPSEAQ
ncbi:nucleoside hydrolase [Rhodococcus opacus]|uniref:Nucleoside hydrolase n=1 Tax=Rhodococcus opacus TaxID=37919 RepID=A0AAX3YPC9_RHOOP|nr:nucleoside hydrolase [Rhodococcus opacus]ELB90788.1 purine nucleosidase [Rhodococcus wratislaviensis IFP 2016]MCZ4589655.1 nucleoside hydrolase [Rhodococcus opacus]MDX5962729.1 nucleoside hydrolase [Rhodococcus opacus]WLF51186.1 nucleoside hydrolase [Rhodococcus opacus]CAG7636905.1 Pyrimidine-specific ribonucleoside hydrolase RihA [Rhodococcus opacus]